MTLKQLQNKLIELEDAYERVSLQYEKGFKAREAFTKYYGIEPTGANIWEIKKESEGDAKKWAKYLELTDGITPVEGEESRVRKEVARDLKDREKKIELQKKKIADFMASNETAKPTNKRDLKVILDFLDKWESNVYDFYMDSADDYYDFYDEWLDHSNSEEDRHNAFEMMTNEFPFVRKFDCPNIKTFEKKLVVYLEDEKQKKYDDLITKVEYYVGTITNVEDLSISKKGDLNGIIEGTNGKVKLTTIGAGGYNIQCFHYRVLLKEL